MLGWFADFSRFAWALLYWNARKSWFRFRRGKVACPCQSPSDSGRAYETGCDACVTWHRPERFRRVCPLLVRTPDGLRCSANTAEVRPFWSVAIRYYGAAFLGLYAAGVLVVFGTLRTVGYPVSIVHVALPPLWHRVGQARGWFFQMRSQQAFAAGRTTEGLLYLANSYDFDPANYSAGLALAKAYQLGQPSHSDEVFKRLLSDHPQHAGATAQHWYRALLARGDFEQIVTLAADQVLRDTRHSSVWMRALIFATRQSGQEDGLRQMLQNQAAAALIWHDLLRAELQVRTDPRAARNVLERKWPSEAPTYTVVYRAETLAWLGHAAAALDLLEQHRHRLDDEAWLTLRLHCLSRAGAHQAAQAAFETYLLAQPLTQPSLKVMCAQLIRNPDKALFARLCAKVAAESMPLSDATAGGWFSLLCTAGAVRDEAELRGLTLRLRQASETPFSALLMVEAFFRREMADRRATTFLPFLPLPLEINYALIEQYPGPRRPASAASIANK